VLHFDFQHPKRRGLAKQERLRKAPALAAAIILLLLAPVIFATQYRRADRRELAALEEQIATLERNRQEWTNFTRFAKDQASFDAGQHVWVDVIFDVFSQLPSNEKLVVNQLELNQDKGAIKLNIKTKTRDEAVELWRKLEGFRREGRELPRFKVTLSAQTEKRGEEYPVVQDLGIRILDDEKKGKKSPAAGPTAGS
jgi:hypothetical protein